MPNTVLIVDDDRAFRSEFREILEDDYDVVEAADGEEAIAIIEKPNLIDLAILDVRMPGIRGTEVLKRLKQLQPGLLIVIFTGYGSKDVILESLRIHADDFLEKPIKIEATLQRIKQLLDGKQDEVRGVIEKLKYFLEKNFHKDMSLKEASGVVCLSPKYVSRIFKEMTGTGFNEYKLMLKMNKAKELLGSRACNINEIAYKTGYHNVESFVRKFKAVTGCTPTEYRKKIADG